MPIRVLVVDDSALMRQILSDLLGSDPNIVVVGTATDPFMAREKIKALMPDVLTLDIEMPRMDGLSFLERLMNLRPMPVVVVSSLTQKGAETALRALELGAVDYVAKPLLDLRAGMTELCDELIAKVKAAAGARVHGRARAVLSGRPMIFDARLSTEGRIVAIGASTGGVEALQVVIGALPAHAPAVLIAQHMPEGFTSSFARRLNDRCAVTVVEATEGARISPGHVYIANGARHLTLARSGAYYVCRVQDGPPVSGHRPSVDVLFRSVAETVRGNAIGVILTGMGSDGAAGLCAMRTAGALTIGQDEASSLIYGMPKVAKQMGGVVWELPLDAIATGILQGTSQMAGP